MSAAAAVIATSFTSFSSSVRTRALSQCLKRAGSSNLFTGAVQATFPICSVRLREQIRLSSCPARRQKVARSAPLKAASKRTVCMAAGAEGTATYVDHVVFFHVQDGVPPEQADAMVNGLRGLAECQLDGLLQMSCGPALPPTLLNKGEAKFAYTHALHSRFRDRASLDAYGTSPQHVAVVTDLVKPTVDDICAVDWFADLSSDPVDFGAGVLHVVLFNLKEDASKEAIQEMVDGLKGLESSIPGLRQMSLGENFAPARAKGFTWGLAARFATPEDLVAYAKDRKHLSVMLKAFKIIDKFADVDFTTGAESKL